SEDDLRRVGYSKERRIDPQIVVGMLVDRTGLPLEIGCYEGNTAETTTIVSIVTSFIEREELAGAPMVVAAYAGMLSVSNREARARAIVAGEKKAKSARFVKVSGDDRRFDQAGLARAQSLVGLKGYVTNVPVKMMPAAEVTAKYHDLWHVEKSFRMSKTDLDARPVFNRVRDAI